MRTYLLLGVSLALASCAAQKALPHYTEAEKVAQRGGISYWQPEPAPADSVPHTKPTVAVQLPPIAAPDSLPFIEVTRKSVFDKLLGRPGKTSIYTPSSFPAKVGKKSTINIYNAPAVVTTNTAGKKAQVAAGAGATATVVGKVKAPTAIGDSATATDNTKAGQRGGAAASGPGATATATTVKPGLPWTYVVAGIACFGFLIWMLFFGGGGMLLAAVRRKSSTANQA